MAFHSAIASSGNELGNLLIKAGERNIAKLNYSGDVLPSEVFSYLTHHQAFVVDVRTAAEWQFVGVPDLTNSMGRLVTISWKLYPTFAQNPNFLSDLAKEEAITKDIPLFFLCRSGGRSLDAAVAATEAGYRYCFNIAGGFEGDVDIKGQRSKKSGWKYENLPWIQG